MIDINNISAKYRQNLILNNISLEAKPSELITLLGPSGAGKSTLLKVIAGLHPQSEGDILLDGISVTNLPPEQRGIVYLSQTPALFPHMNVEENMMFGLSIKNIEKTEAKNRIAKLIDLLGLNGLEKRHVWELSGGQQQRVAIGRALAIKPKVLLLDEPFSSLDVTLRENLRKLIRQICDQYEVIMIMVTHDPNEALALSDRIILLKDGVILQNGTTEEIYRHPVNDDAASIIGQWGTFDGRFYRPNDIVLVPDPQGMEIEDVIKTGTNVTYSINCHGSLEKLITQDIIPYEKGTRISVHWR